MPYAIIVQITIHTSGRKIIENSTFEAVEDFKLSKKFKNNKSN